MGQLIEFKSAKDRILGTSSSAEQVQSPSMDLSSALETFTFSRLPLRERIARILATILSRQAKVVVGQEGLDGLDSMLVDGNVNFLTLADEVAVYAAENFTKPYKEPEIVPEA